MKITQDAHGFHRDERGRFIGKKQYNEHLKRINTDLTKLTKAIPIARLSGIFGGALMKAVQKVFKLIRGNKALLYTALVVPLSSALKAVKGIFGFMSKLASLSFNSIIKLFGLLWVWSKLGSLGGLNELSQAGHGGGGTGGGSQAAQRADTTFGTNHYKTLYDNIQNMANNPALWGNFVKLGFTNEDIKRFGSQDPSQSIREFLQGVEKRKDDLGGWQSYQAQTIMSGALSGLGLDFANMRGVSERGISGEQEKYFKQQQRNNAGLEKMEREYIKLQFEFTDLWRHFAVSLGPTMMKISRIFIKFGHRLAKFLGTNDNMEKALDGLYNVTVRVFEWLGTKGFDYVDKFFTWFDETGLPLLKKGWEWLQEFIAKASKQWDEWGGFEGIIDKIKTEFNELKEALGPVITFIKALGTAIGFVIDTFMQTIDAFLNWGPVKAALEGLGILSDYYSLGFNKLMYLATGNQKFKDNENDILNRMGSVTNNLSNKELQAIGASVQNLQGYNPNAMGYGNPLPTNQKDVLKDIRKAQVEQQALKFSGDATITINIEDGIGTKTISVQEMLNSFTMNNNQAGRGN